MVYVTTALVNHRAARYRPYRQPLTVGRAAFTFLRFFTQPTVYHATLLSPYVSMVYRWARRVAPKTITVGILERSF